MRMLRSRPLAATEGTTRTALRISLYQRLRVQLKVRVNSGQRRLNGGTFETLPEGLGWPIASELFKSIWVNPSQGEPMAERFSEMENSAVPSQATLEERLKEYPELKAKIETMLGIIENAGGDIEKAAEAERRIIEEMRQMGNEVLHGWARRQQEKKEQEYNAKPGVNRKEKKTSPGTRG